MLDILQYWFSAYPSTYSVWDFVYSFSPENPAFVMTVISAAITFGIGFLEYIWSFKLIRAENSAPYPIYMHTFYFALDFMGVIVFALAAVETGGFWLFVGASIAEVVWCLFEIYNLVKCVTVERNDIWGHLYTAERGFADGVPVSGAVLRIIAQILIFVTCINCMRVFLNDPCMFKWYIFTNILMAIGPGLYWERRNTQVGASLVLSIIILVGTVNSFIPTNMWAMATPYFSFANNPWFYLAGVVAICFAVRNVIVYRRCPKKPAIIEATGKKSVL